MSVRRCFHPIDAMVLGWLLVRHAGHVSGLDAGAAKQSRTASLYRWVTT